MADAVTCDVRLIGIGANMSDSPVMQSADWRNTSTLALGVWLFISPGFLDFNTIQAATANTAALGAVVTVLGGIAMRIPRKWVLWSIIASGAWLIAAPFMFGFQAESTPMWNSVVCGLICIVMSGWQFVAPQAHKAAAAE